MEIVLFIAGVIGLTHIMVEGKIMTWLRDWLDNPTWTSFIVEKVPYLAFAVAWTARVCCIDNVFLWTIKKAGEMIHCHQCCGFWMGLFCGYLAPSITGWQILLAGFAGSFLSQGINIVFNYLDAHTIMVLEDKHE